MLGVRRPTLTDLGVRLKERVKATPVLGEAASGIRAIRRRARLEQHVLSVRLAKTRYRVAGYGTVPRRDFLDDLRLAIARSTGYAAGKIGRSNQFWMAYEIVRAKERDAERLAAFETELRFHGLNQMGVFPPDPGFYLEFNRFYVEHVRNLDCIGICYYPGELEILKYYGFKNKLIGYACQEPFITVGHYPYLFTRDDLRSSQESRNGYLDYFRDKKLLLICPFAEFLKERATRETFEAAWAKPGYKWFHPGSVDALEVPYGFSATTQQRFRTVLDLFDAITAEVDRRDFDVALIAAAGLAIPLASHIKSQGRVALDLGGVLQVVFGVHGKRWLRFQNWHDAYFNEHWTRVPDRYRPTETRVCDSGAYW